MTDDLRSEYDFTKLNEAVRRKYYRRLLKEGSKIVVLDPDVAEVFRELAAVNDALCSLLKTARSIRRPSRPSHWTVRKRTAA